MKIEGIVKTLEYLNNPDWHISAGEDYGKIHFRNKHRHVLIDPNTGTDTEHYDDIDPNESPESLVKHMWQSKKGKKVLIGIAVAGIAYLLRK